MTASSPCLQIEWRDRRCRTGIRLDETTAVRMRTWAVCSDNRQETSSSAYRRRRPSQCRLYREYRTANGRGWLIHLVVLPVAHRSRADALYANSNTNRNGQCQRRQYNHRMNNKWMSADSSFRCKSRPRYTRHRSSGSVVSAF